MTSLEATPLTATSTSNPIAMQAALAIEAKRAAIQAQRFTIGFDGFVDEIIHAVSTRQSKDAFTRIATLTEFSQRIASAAGKSANIELVPLLEKMGGNGPLMASAVAGMGAQVTCVGMLGYPDLLPVFKPMQQFAKVISVGQPGHTDALEFQDGKLMLGKLNTIKDMNWKRLMDVIGEKPFLDLLLGSNMVACTNWTMLTEMEEIFSELIRILPKNSPVTFFFDLADPEKRDRKDMEKVLEQIRALNERGRSVFGLNLREAEQVSDVLGLKEMPDETEGGVEGAAVRIRKAMGIHGVVVHAIKCAGASVGTESAGIPGPYCASPKLSTGAGDHFNGGFTSGLMGGLSVRDSLYSGVGASGWYVRNAKSPKLDDVVGLLRQWAEGHIQD